MSTPYDCYADCNNTKCDILKTVTIRGRVPKPIGPRFTAINVVVVIKVQKIIKCKLVKDVSE